MKVILGTPVHGWVDLSIKDGDYVLKNSISDVPFDFVDQIVVGITNLLIDGSEQQAVLGLEPNYYVLTLTGNGESFSIKIEMEIEHPKPTDRIVLHRSKGSFAQILLPLIDAFQKFYSNPVDEPHWPKCDPSNIAKLMKASDDFQTSSS